MPRYRESLWWKIPRRLLPGSATLAIPAVVAPRAGLIGPQAMGQMKWA